MEDTSPTLVRAIISGVALTAIIIPALVVALETATFHITLLITAAVVPEVWVVFFQRLQLIRFHVT